jgi:hypothetical protein
MELSALVLWIFLALMIGWVGVVLLATWLQVRREAGRVAERHEG